MVMVSGPESCLKHDFSLKRLSVRPKRILKPSLVLIFQGEADGDDFGPPFLLKTRIVSETAFRSTPDDFKTIFGIDFARQVDGDSFASRTKSRVHFVGDRNSDPSYMGPGADDFRRERSPEHENR